MSEQYFLKKLGLNIRRARRAKELTQIQVSRYIGGNSAAYICEIEKGLRTVPSYTLYRLELLLGERLMP